MAMFRSGRSDGAAPRAGKAGARDGPHQAACRSARLPFADRAAAGEALAAHLLTLPVAHESPLVLALPRGGVPVALPVARALHAPLDLLLVRKIGAPRQPELAVAALVDGTPPEVVADRFMCEHLGVDDDYLVSKAHAAIEENARRRALYLGGRRAWPVAGRSVIVVDDGVATGTTMRAALQGLRRQQPRRLVVAVPVASREAAARLRAEVDEWICLAEPEPFEAVGRHYLHFDQVDDDEVVRALRAAGVAAPGAQPAGWRSAAETAAPAPAAGAAEPATAGPACGSAPAAPAT